MAAVLPVAARSTHVRLDAKGLVVSWPASARALFEASDTAVLGRPLSLLFEPHQRTLLDDELRRLSGEPPGSVHTLELTAMRPGGSALTLECVLCRVSVPADAPVPGVDALLRDVSARADELQRLRELAAAQARELQAVRSRFTDLTETIDEVFWSADAAISRMLYISPGYERIWGRSCSSLYETPTSFIDAIHEDDRARVREALTVQRDGLPFDLEYRIRRPNGTVVWIWDRGFPVRQPDGTVDRYIGVAQDVTERRAAEAAARRQDTLDAIGHMTGGLAHDFNNVLGVIVGHLDLISLAVPEGASVRESIEGAMDAALRGEQLARRLLGLARQEQAERRVVCLASAVEGLRQLLEYAAGPATQLELALTARPSVRIVPGEFDAALINLAVNARAAMPEGGHVRIAVEERHLAAPAAAARAVPPGAYALVSVTDTGCGMSQETLRHLGEPFFSTRPSAEGTGLGVSMVHAFVRNAGGAMRVESEPGVGTRFELMLPVVPPAPAA